MRQLEAISILHVGTVTSTNDEAKRRALEQPEHGLMLIAESQTGGRGSNNRHWISEKGNLFASLLLMPDIAHMEAQNFVKMAGLAVMDVLRKHNLKPTLKAPNDVLVGGKKICGILVETVTKGSTPPAVIVGVGLNVASSPEIAEYPTTSLYAEGLAIGSEKLEPLLAEHLRLRYEAWQLHGFTQLEKEYHAACD
jgi:BirA family biotin operon repressor/biotin-[acetyl-CoA-carboxylase] ligase